MGKRRTSKEKNRTKRSEPSRPPAWAEFQTLVARIEHQIARKDAVVRSPDRIRDVDTGHVREIDASIRFDSDDGPTLIVFECRRRGRAQDVRWIEELYGKQRSVGATRVVAVASGSGFSAPAAKKAEAFGIDVRLVSDITDAEIGRWVIQAAGLKRERTRIAIGKVRFSLQGGGVGDGVHEFLAAQGSDAKILHGTNGVGNSLNDLVSYMHDQGLPRPASNGEVSVIPVTWQPDQGVDYFVDTPVGRRMIRAITLWLRLKNEGTDPIDLSQVHEYAGPDGALRFVGEGRWTDPETGERYTVLASRPADDPEIAALQTGNASGD